MELHIMEPHPCERLSSILHNELLFKVWFKANRMGLMREHCYCLNYC
jgi:hypothetical protein